MAYRDDPRTLDERVAAIEEQLRRGQVDIVEVQTGVALVATPDHGDLSGLGEDDHHQYQLRSEKGQESGYASLGSDGLVPASQLPDATVTPGDIGALQLQAKSTEVLAWMGLAS